MEMLNQVLQWLLVFMGIALVVSLIGFALIAKRIRGLRVPRDADFFTTMHYIPLLLVVLLDLLDFALDVFSAPLSWIILDRLGLPNLRNKAVVEALIPFTQPIPTFTIGWLLARFLGFGKISAAGGGREPRIVDDRYPEQGRRHPTRIIDMDE